MKESNERKTLERKRLTEWSGNGKLWWEVAKINRKVYVFLFSPAFLTPKSMHFNGISAISRFASIRPRGQSRFAQCCHVEIQLWWSLTHKFEPLSELQTILTVLTLERTGESKMEEVITLAVSYHAFFYYPALLSINCSTKEMWHGLQSAMPHER